MGDIESNGIFLDLSFLVYLSLTHILLDEFTGGVDALLSLLSLLLLLLLMLLTLLTLLTLLILLI